MTWFDWQHALVAVCIGWAAYAVARRGWRLLRSARHGGPRCGACGTCAADRANPAAATTNSIVPVEALNAAARK